MTDRSQAYERLWLTAHERGMTVGIDVAPEILPCGFDAQGEPNAWRRPLTEILAMYGKTVRQRVKIEQPDTSINFDRACARLTGLLKVTTR